MGIPHGFNPITDSKVNKLCTIETDNYDACGRATYMCS